MKTFVVTAIAQSVLLADWVLYPPKTGAGNAVLALGALFLAVLAIIAVTKKGKQ